MHVREIHWIDPVTVMRCLADRSNLTFLDSAARHEALGRYSYVTCDPFSTYTVADGQASCGAEKRSKAIHGKHFALFSQRIHKNTAPIFLRFRGAWQGFLLMI